MGGSGAGAVQVWEAVLIQNRIPAPADLVLLIWFSTEDIVDTCWFTKGTRGTLTSQKLLKVVLGAVDKRIDRKDTRTAEAKRK